MTVISHIQIFVFVWHVGWQLCIAWKSQKVRHSAINEGVSTDYKKIDGLNLLHHWKLALFTIIILFVVLWKTKINSPQLHNQFLKLCKISLGHVNCKLSGLSFKKLAFGVTKLFVFLCVSSTCIWWDSLSEQKVSQ